MYEQAIQQLKARRPVMLDLKEGVTPSQAFEVADAIEKALGMTLERRMVVTAARHALVLWAAGLCPDPFANSLLGDRIHARRDHPAA